MVEINTESQNGKQNSKFFVLINCYEGKIDQALNGLEKIDSIEEIRELENGPYDILIILESNSENDLKNILFNKIKKLESVRSTLTLQSSKGIEIVT